MTASSKPVVFVTGANTGIGLTVVRALCHASTPYEIVIGSRSVQKGEEALSTVKAEFPHTESTLSVVQFDLESDESITKAAESIASEHAQIDVLVNNGGAAFDQHRLSGRSTTREVWNSSWNVNVAGTQVATETLMPLLLKSPSPRLLFLTSGTACMAEMDKFDAPLWARINASPPAGWPKEPILSAPAYRSAKTGLNMMMREWCRVLRNDGVKIWAISPGFLATNLGGMSAEAKAKTGAGDAQIGGDFIRDVIEGKRDGDVGKAIRSDSVQEW